LQPVGVHGGDAGRHPKSADCGGLSAPLSRAQAAPREAKTPAAALHGAACERACALHTARGAAARRATDLECRLCPSNVPMPRPSHLGLSSNRSTSAYVAVAAGGSGRGSRRPRRGRRPQQALSAPAGARPAAGR
jgi:hypothetical protein